MGVQLSGISEAEKKKYKISKQIVLPIQFIADKNHVSSEFCIVDSGATANFVSQELVDRFKLPTIDISPICMSTANGQQTIITEMIETLVRVDFHTGPKEFKFSALVSPVIKNTIYFGLPSIQEHYADIQFDSANGDVISLDELKAYHMKDEMDLILVIATESAEGKADVQLDTIDIEHKLSDSDRRTQEILDGYKDVVTQKRFYFCTS